jgi:RecA-family ATPase
LNLAPPDARHLVEATLVKGAIPKPNGATTAPKPLRMFEVVNAAELAGKAIPVREWLVQDLIPANSVTILGGDGATGKSIIAEQLCAAAILGRKWLGFDVRQGPALFLSAEDEKEEIHRRLEAIRVHYGVEWCDLDGLTYKSLIGEDAVLASADPRGSLLQPSELWKLLCDHIVATKPSLVVLDTLADLFAGNENDRTQARQFIGMLKGLAIKSSVTIVLLAHPSMSGMSSGDGQSGSRAWNNSVRSRLYFERVVGDNKTEDDPNLRVLKTKKANYGPTAGEWRVRWHEGVFVRIDDGPTAFGAIGAAARAERVFRPRCCLIAQPDLCTRHIRQGRCSRRPV